MTNTKGQVNMKMLCPELNDLPEGWFIKADTSEHCRLYFQNLETGVTSIHHPTYGQLPRPWILSLQVINNKGRREPRYYNVETREVTKENPRTGAKYLEDRKSSKRGTPADRIASNMTRNAPGLMEAYSRAEIGTVNIRHAYVEVHTIDSGDGNIGGMNDGVFVVRMRGQPQLYIEKRFKADIITFAKKEIKMLHRLKHGSLTSFCAAFVDETSDPKDASVYVEFCDRGSLEDLIKVYSKKRQDTYPKPDVPEPFIWHAFMGLTDGLAYLRGGRSFMGDESVKKYALVPGWKPILHRDIKPDNVLFRSRSTLGSSKYFYCVLSDFGLACEDDDSEKYQKDRCKLGTKHYWAPELCHNPYPKKQPAAIGDPDEQFTTFPFPYKHSHHSDVWSLGACIYNLANPDPTILDGAAYQAFSHITFHRMPPGFDTDTYYEGRESRKADLRVRDIYSAELREGVRYATRVDLNTRPNAIAVVRRLKELMIKGNVSKLVPEKLPVWVTKVHDYHSRAVEDDEDVTVK